MSWLLGGRMEAVVAFFRPRLLSGGQVFTPQPSPSFSFPYLRAAMLSASYSRALHSFPAPFCSGFRRSLTCLSPFLDSIRVPLLSSPPFVLSSSSSSSSSSPSFTFTPSLLHCLSPFTFTCSLSCWVLFSAIEFIRLSPPFPPSFGSICRACQVRNHCRHRPSVHPCPPPRSVSPCS